MKSRIRPGPDHDRDAHHEYRDRIGQLLNGTIKRFERGDIIIDLGRLEGVVPRSEQAPHERYGQRDRIRAVITKVYEQAKGPPVVLSRSTPELVRCLFEAEVPEIKDGVVVIKSLARQPGERTRIAVMSNKPGVDAVFACAGVKGSRLQAIVRELRGEKIDVIEWSADD